MKIKNLEEQRRFDNERAELLKRSRRKHVETIVSLEQKKKRERKRKGKILREVVR